MRIPMIISDLGYWDLKFKNGDRYYLTNLLHDFLLENPKVKNTKYRFRFYQYIDKTNSERAVELKRVREKSLIEKFVEQYESKSEKQLNDILDNKTYYQVEAVKAAEIVLYKKNVG
jgi:DNA-directed RNA polymerase subunit L